MIALLYLFFQKCYQRNGIMPVPESLRDHPRNLTTKYIPEFLKGFKSPCWVECLPYNLKNIYPADAWYQERRILRTPLAVLNATLNKNKPLWRLRCLPYYYIIGMPKCGTSDLFSR